MKIVTTADINIRSGPDMVFEVVGHVVKGTQLNSFEYKKDAQKIGWYHIDKGWVCANYVTNAKDAIVTNPDMPMDLQKNAVDVGSISSQIKNGSAARTTSSDNVMRSLFSVAGINSEDSLEGAKNALFKKRAFGLPYQFRESVDMRGAGKLGLDYIYTMTEAPYVSIVPGKPLYLPDMSDDERENYFKILNDFMEDIAKTGVHITAPLEALSSKNTEIKYFGFEMDYVNYISYVNTLCWMFAIMLGIGDETVPGMEGLDGADNEHKLNTFAKFNWAKFRLSNLFAHQMVDFNVDGMQNSNENAVSGAAKTASGAWEKFWEGIDYNKGVGESAADALSYALDKMDKESYYTDFYINPNVSYSESFTNGTSPSMIEGLMNQASDYAKEIGFLLSSGIGSDARSQEKVREQIDNISKGVTGGNGILSRLLSGASTIISGANIAFPELWKTSNFGRSYNIDITLKTPYGNKKSIFLDILVPMAHWICLAAPRMMTVNTYGNPFLCKFFIPGFCSVDMGIVENLTITKGGDGSSWSADGLPTEVQLSISIKDLYTQLSMHRINGVSATDIYNFIWNTNLLDYLAVQTGLNMRQAEAKTKFDILKALTLDKLDTTYAANALNDEISQEFFTKSSRFLRGTIFTR